MGYQLIAAALQPDWGQRLTSTERLILVLMCQAALDAESNGVPGRAYWGGTDLLVLQMLGDLPPKGSREYRSASERVRSALRKLEVVGAVALRRPATNGRTAEYEIKVAAPPLPVDNQPRPDPDRSGAETQIDLGLRPR